MAHAFGLALTLAAPFVIASDAPNRTLGVINWAMPQLMVVFAGVAITAAALILLFLLAPMMLGIWVTGLGGFLADPVGGADGGGAGRQRQDPRGNRAQARERREKGEFARSADLNIAGSYVGFLLAAVAVGAGSGGGGRSSR
ncbi:MAG: hypothetical protein U5K36_15575 [Roseovarius sp.]|nr:hypothetical protein [Roseovarius sp.]